MKKYLRNTIKFTVVIMTLFFVGFSIEIVQAATAAYDLNTPADYTISDTAKIELDGAVGKLVESVNPTLLGNHDISEYVSDVSLSSDGTKAYVIDGIGGLQIIDITNPASPTLLGTYDTSGFASRITLSSDGTKAYVADGSSGLKIIDISTSANPTLLGSYNTLGTAFDIELSSDGTKAYVADGDSGLQIIDITNPVSPTSLGNYNNLASARDVTLSSDGTKAYVADWTSGLQIIDISTLATPTLLGNYNTIGIVRDVILSSDGTKAYVADHNNGLEIIDITTPASPTLLGGYDTPGYAAGVALSTDSTKAYVADYNNGLQIIDVTPLYSSDSPYITANTSVAFTQKVDSFTETLTTNNQGTVSYQVSTDNGTTWYYWNGTVWTTTTQTDGTQTSSASGINTNIATLDTDGGNFKWRAYLNSNGSQKVELDQIDITYDSNQPPTDITLSSNSTNENTATGTTIATISTTDPDTTDTHTYTLVAGAGDEDNAKFQIAGGNLQLNFTPDYENPTDLGDTAGNNTYTVRIQTDDGNGGTYQKSFIVTVNNLNNAPTDIALSTTSTNENVSAGTTIATLSGTDDGENNPATLTYSLVAGTGDADNTAFTIVGTNLNINASPDYETKNSYSIRVQINDGTLTYQKPFTITVNDIDETLPVITLLGNNPINIHLNDTYTDAGATATDDIDGDITANIVTLNSVNTSILGSYTVTYNVNDSAGNSAIEVSRTVNVVAGGTPIITLLGANPQTVNKGEIYTELGATATDTEDGNITSSIVINSSSVNTNQAGTYTVSYTVTDSSANTATETRTVNVIETVSSGGGGGGGGKIILISTCNENYQCVSRYPVQVSSGTDKVYNNYKECIKGQGQTGKQTCAKTWARERGYQLCSSSNACRYVEKEKEEEKPAKKEVKVNYTPVKKENPAKLEEEKFDPVYPIIKKATEGKESQKKIEKINKEESKVCEGDYLTNYLRINEENKVSEVRKLQRFLKNREGFKDLPNTGIFGSQTHSSVIEFQERYTKDILSPWGLDKGTGWVYQTTKKKINELWCNK